MADLSPYPDTDEDTRVGPERGSPPSTPRWVYAFGVIALVLVLLVVVVMLAGGGGQHGPGRHTPSGGAGGQTPPTSVVAEDHTPPDGHGRYAPLEGGH